MYTIHVYILGCSQCEASGIGATRVTKGKISKVPQRRSQRLKQKDDSRKSSPSLDMSVSSCEDKYVHVHGV